MAEGSGLWRAASASTGYRPARFATLKEPGLYPDGGDLYFKVE